MTNTTTPTAPTMDGTSPAPVIGAETAPITLSEHAQAVGEQLRGLVVPPDFWRSGRPPLREAWNFVRRGPQLPDDDRARIPARIGVGLLLVIRAPLHVLDWTFERGSRAAFALFMAFCLLKTVGLL